MNNDFHNDPVILALRGAIQKTDSVPLRLALGKHLQSLKANKEALSEFESALRLSPSDSGALEGARSCSEELGDLARETSYRITLEALKSSGELLDENDEDEDEYFDEDELDEGPSRVSVLDLPERPRLRAVTNEEREEPSVTFKDVGGMADVKQRLTRAFISPLRQPEIFKKFGKSISGGLVLYGPPGCGKTFMAKAVAGEIGARFINIGLSDVLDMWFGESEKKLHEFFETARRQAPVLIFIDEIDALGQRRTSLKGSAGKTLVNQLLVEMDGMASKNEGVFVLGATNHPWDLDTALRRPGRFDRLVFVSPPDLEARRDIFALKLQDRPVAPGLDMLAFAKASPGFSGADIEAVIRLATDIAIERSLDKGEEVPIDSRMLSDAIKDVKPSTRAWFETARNYALFANEGGVYDDMLPHLKSLGLV